MAEQTNRAAQVRAYLASLLPDGPDRVRETYARLAANVALSAPRPECPAYERVC